MDPCKCPRCRKQTCKRYSKPRRVSETDPNRDRRPTESRAVSLTSLVEKGTNVEPSGSSKEELEQNATIERIQNVLTSEKTGQVGGFEKSVETNSGNQHGREIGTSPIYPYLTPQAASPEPEPGSETPRTAQCDTIKSMCGPPSDRARTSHGCSSGHGFDASVCFSQTNSTDYDGSQVQFGSPLLALCPHSSSSANVQQSTSLPVSPKASLNSFNIPVPRHSDYAITVNISLHDKYTSKASCCDPTTICPTKYCPSKKQMNLQIKSTNVTKTVSDSAFDKKESMHSCSKSISDHSSYHSANKSYCSEKPSHNFLENWKSENLSGALDIPSPKCEDQVIKQLSNTTDNDNINEVTSLYRCPCSIKSSQFSVPSDDKPPTTLCMTRNEKICGNPSCYSIDNTENSQTFQLKREHEDVSSVKKVNIDIRQKMEEMQNTEKDSSEESFCDREVILPGVRVDIGSEKLKSIHIDVTPGLDTTSSGMITIPVHLRFKKTPSTQKLQYDDKTIKAYYKKQKLLFENCTECSEYADPCTGETVEPTIEKVTSDMDFVNPATKSQESVFVKEVSTQHRPKKNKKHKPQTKSTTTITESWCHRSTYIEPYLRFDPCPSLDTVEVQTELCLGPKLLSESLNSVTIPEKSTTSLKIPWNKYTLPSNTIDMFPSQIRTNRREIFPQPEEVIMPETPPIKPSCCSFFKKCCKKKQPPPSICARLKETGGMVVKPQRKSKSKVDFVNVNKIDESSLQAPEPRPRPYRPPRTYKSHQDIQSGSVVLLHPKESMHAIHKNKTREIRKPMVREIRSRENESAFSSASEFDRNYDSNTGVQEISQNTIPKNKTTKKSRENESAFSSASEFDSNTGVQKSPQHSNPTSKHILRKFKSTREVRRPILKAMSKTKDDSTFSSASEFDKHYDRNTGEQTTSQYYSNTGRYEKAVQQPPLVKRWSSQSCNSQSSYQFVDNTPSYYNANRLTTTRSLPEQYEVTHDTESKPSTTTKSEKTKSEKTKLEKTKSKNKTCCVEDFCMELPPRVSMPTKYKFVYMDCSPLHEQYLNKLKKENMVKRTGDGLPWDKLILPNNIQLRKISDIKIPELDISDKMIQFGDSNSPPKLASCPNMTNCENKSVKFAYSTPFTCASHDTEQIINTDASVNESVKPVYKYVECTDPLTGSEKKLCECLKCPKVSTTTKFAASPPCPYASIRKSSIFLKPDPVIAAFQKCEAELKPVRDTLAQLKNSLKKLNMPELDCLFKKDEPSFVFPPMCKHKSTKNVFKAKTQHFYTNTTCTAILAQHGKYWNIDSSSSSSESCPVVVKRNKGIQKGSSTIMKNDKKNCKCIHRSKYINTSSDCTPCTSDEEIKVSETSIVEALKSILLDSSPNCSPCTSKQVKHRCTSPQRKQRPSKQIKCRMSEASCPVVQAIKSILLKSSESTKSSKRVNRVKMHLRFNDKHNM